jgi:hypothetical protein
MFAQIPVANLNLLATPWGSGWAAPAAPGQDSVVLGNVLEELKALRNEISSLRTEMHTNASSYSRAARGLKAALTEEVQSSSRAQAKAIDSNRATLAVLREEMQAGFESQGAAARDILHFSKTSAQDLQVRLDAAQARKGTGGLPQAKVGGRL